VSNLPTVWTNVLAGWLIGDRLEMPEAAWLMGGVSLLYWAGMVLNDAFDVSWDRQYAPERPIPSGAISRAAAWGLGLALMLSGAAAVMFRTTAPWPVLGGLIAAILLYDGVHKRWKGSVLIMGLCRALVYLLAFESARSEMRMSPTSPLIYLIGTGVLFYIAGITLVTRGERSPGSFGDARLGFLLLLCPSLFPLLTVYCEQTIEIKTGYVYAGTAAICLWIIHIFSTFMAGKIPRGVGKAIAGIALYDAALVFFLDPDPRAGVFCLACFGLCLLAQRHVPAT